MRASCSGAIACSAGSKVAASDTYSKPGRTACDDVAQFRVVARLQRIRRGHERDRDTYVHRREREQTRLDAVVAQDRDGPLDPEAALQQRGGDAAHGPQRLRVGDAAPGAVTPALEQERTVRRRAAPVLEKLADAARVTTERLCATQQQRTVAAAFELDRRCRKQPAWDRARLRSCG
jgi:hypothetical protein